MTEDHARPIPKIPMDLELQGEMIHLKASTEKDYSKLKVILSDHKTMNQLKYMAFLNEGGWTIDQVREREEMWKEGQRKGKSLSFLVNVKPSGQIAGTCGFKHIDFIHKNAEFGLVIHHPFWGQGVAAECHLLALEYAIVKLELHRIRFETFVTNVRMRQFYENIGIQLESIAKEGLLADGQFIDNAVYVLLDREWPMVKQKLKKKLAHQRNNETCSN